VASLPPAFTLVSCMAYFSTLKTEARCYSEMLVHTQWTLKIFYILSKTSLIVYHTLRKWSPVCLMRSLVPTIFLKFNLLSSKWWQNDLGHHLMITHTQRCFRHNLTMQSIFHYYSSDFERCYFFLSHNKTCIFNSHSLWYLYLMNLWGNGFSNANMRCFPQMEVMQNYVKNCSPSAYLLYIIMIKSFLYISKR
jgi:hypothetical protein